MRPVQQPEDGGGVAQGVPAARPEVPLHALQVRPATQSLSQSAACSDGRPPRMPQLEGREKTEQREQEHSTAGPSWTCGLGHGEAGQGLSSG